LQFLEIKKKAPVPTRICMATTVGLFKDDHLALNAYAGANSQDFIVGNKSVALLTSNWDAIDFLHLLVEPVHR
jgi:hypothetical protein